MASSKQSPQAEQSKKTASKKREIKAAPPQNQVASSPLVQLALADPSAVAPAVILALQRSHGNGAVQRLIAHSAQSKKDSPTTQSKPAAAGLTRYAPTSRQLGSQPTSTPLRSTVTIPAGFQPRPQLTLQTKPVIPQSEPLPQSAALSESGPTTGYVPPVAPPAAPPPNDNKRHRVGSPYRHLDGVSNRKIQTKLTVGPTHGIYAQRDLH